MDRALELLLGVTAKKNAPPFGCPCCGVRRKSCFAMNYHLSNRVCLGVSLAEAGVKRPTFACTICGREYTSQAGLSYHSKKDCSTPAPEDNHPLSDLVEEHAQEMTAMASSAAPPPAPEEAQLPRKRPKQPRRATTVDAGGQATRVKQGAGGGGSDTGGGAGRRGKARAKGGEARAPPRIVAPDPFEADLLPGLGVSAGHAGRPIPLAALRSGEEVAAAGSSSSGRGLAWLLDAATAAGVGPGLLLPAGCCHPEVAVVGEGAGAGATTGAATAAAAAATFYAAALWDASLPLPPVPRPLVESSSGAAAPAAAEGEGAGDGGAVVQGREGEQRLWEAERPGVGRLPLLSCGGPVWGLSLLPAAPALPAGDATTATAAAAAWIAVSAHAPGRCLHAPGALSPPATAAAVAAAAAASPGASRWNALQIWSVPPPLPPPSDDAACPAALRRRCRLRLLLLHACDGAADVAWSPHAPPLPLQQGQQGQGQLRRLGVLAAAHLDGCVRVYAVPHPDALPERLSGVEGPWEGSAAVDGAGAGAGGEDAPPVALALAPRAVFDLRAEVSRQAGVGRWGHGRPLCPATPRLLLLLLPGRRDCPRVAPDHPRPPARWLRVRRTMGAGERGREHPTTPLPACHLRPRRHGSVALLDVSGVQQQQPQQQAPYGSEGGSVPPWVLGFAPPAAPAPPPPAPALLPPTAIFCTGHEAALAGGGRGSAAVRSVAWSPGAAAMFVAAHLGGLRRVWSLRRPAAPLADNEAQRYKMVRGDVVVWLLPVAAGAPRTLLPPPWPIMMDGGRRTCSPSPSPAAARRCSRATRREASSR